MPKNTEPASPVSLIQTKLNERADKNLAKVVGEALVPIANFRNCMPRNEKAVFKKENCIVLEGGGIAIELYVIIEATRKLLIDELTERYRRDETETFLRQVDQVRDLVQE